MALVRCEIHKIPFNDQNPRGCPVCAQEKRVGGDSSIMQELARASQATRQPGGVVAPPEPRAPSRHATQPAWGVTSPPRRPTLEEGFLGRFFRVLREHRNLSIGGLLVAGLAVGLFATSGPRYVEQAHPAPFAGTPRALPIAPNTSVRTIFAMLGNQTPRTNPDGPQLARYSYGADLNVDALNGIVYAITFSVTNRSWQGVRVGVPQREAEGALATLGRPQEVSQPSDAPEEIIENYVVYRSLNARPRRTLRAEVRPPNGCYDVLVDLKPRANGLLIDGDRRYAVVGERGEPLQWVATQVRIVSRSLSGPYADGIAC